MSVRIPTSGSIGRKATLAFLASSLFATAAIAGVVIPPAAIVQLSACSPLSNAYDCSIDNPNSAPGIVQSTSFGTVSASSTVGDVSGIAQAAASSGIDPSLSASAANYGSANATATYYFEVTGAPGAVTLLYSAAGREATSGGINVSAAASYFIYANGSGLTDSLVALSAGSPFAVADASVTIQTDTVYVEQMGVSVGNVFGVNTSASAELDPSLGLTSQEMAAGYSLELSPNISTHSVPEPGPAALLMAALLGLGATRAFRGRRSAE